MTSAHSTSSKPTTSPVSGEVVGGRTVKHGVSRLLPYLPPWLVWLVLLVIAVAVWGVWGRSYDARPWYSMGALIATMVAIVGVLRYSTALHEALRVLAVGSTALAGLWLIVAGIVGPFTRPVIDLWAGVGFVICVFWSMRRALLGASNANAVAATGPAAKLLEVLNGAKLGPPKVLDTGQVVGSIEANRGEQTMDDVRRAAELIEGVAGLRPGALRIHKSTTDAGAGGYAIVPHDPLVEPIPWPGPSNPGASIHEGVAVGVYETLARCVLYFTGDDELGRALAHWLIMGMTRAGKSAAMVMAMADALTRRDVAVWAHDHVKGLQTLGPLLEGGGLDWVTMDKKAGRTMLGAVRDVVRARAHHLGERGIEQWEPGCGLSLLFVWIEEATELANLETLTRLVQQAGSTGVVILVSMQRASHTGIDTDTRSQLSGNWCFGTRDHTDSGFALPDEVLDAGAAPERWGNTKPGYSYVAAPGIAEDMWSIPLRTYRAQREQIVAACQLGAQHRTPLDQISVAAAGAPYAQRPNPASFLTANVVGPARDVVPAEEEGELVDDLEYKELVDQLRDDDDEDLDDDEEPMPMELDPHIKVDPTQPIGPPPVDMPIGEPDTGAKLTVEQARAVVQQHLAALHEAGNAFTTPADVANMKPPTTMTREWVRRELHRLCRAPSADEFSLEREPDDPPGRFRIVAPQRLLAGVGT